MVVGIYKITNPKGRVYIGQSTDVERRWEGYRKAKNYRSQVKLKHSFEKYGIEKHLFEVIEICKIEELNKQERFYQDAYDVLGPNGLNCRLQQCNGKTGKNSEDSNRKRSEALKGKKRAPRPDVSERNKQIHRGKIISDKQKELIRKKLKGKTFSEERNKKISESNKGKLKTQEHRKKISEAKKGQPAWNKGIPRSEETKQKIKETKLQNKLAKKKLNHYIK